MMMSENSELRRENQRLRGLLARAGILVCDVPADYPSEREFDRLLQIVLKAWPRLAPETRLVPDDRAAELRAEFRKSFEASFLALCFLRRTDRINQVRSPADWKHDAEDWLMAQGFDNAISSTLPYMAAVCAHHDIPYTPMPTDPVNRSASFGLLVHGGTLGRAYRGAWRDLLERGQVSPATEFDRPLNRWGDQPGTLKAG
jgi:hypothetical protein